jgi:hypothetical protein
LRGEDEAGEGVWAPGYHVAGPLRPKCYFHGFDISRGRLFLFKCQINLFELGKILFCEVLNFVEGRLRSTLEIAS